MGILNNALWLLWQLVWFTLSVLTTSVLLVYFSSPAPTDFSVYFPDRHNSFLVLQTAVFENITLTSGISLSVVRAGSAGFKSRSSKLVIMLHGFPESALLCWHRQIELLAPFAASHNLLLVAPDQRGYNTSDKPADVYAYHLKFLVQDVIELMDHYGGRVDNKVVLIGHDWGGAVAWATAILHPERVEKLIVANMPHPLVMESTLRSNLEQTKKSWFVFYFSLPWIAESDYSKHDYLKFLTRLAHRMPPGTLSNATAQRYHEMWRANGLASMMKWYRAAVWYSKSNPLPMKDEQKMRVKVPTLLLWGDQDVALDSCMAQPSIDMCDNGKLIVFPGAGHFVQHELPQHVHEEIRQFLLSH